MTDEQHSNLRTKVQFEARLHELGLDKKSSRYLASRIFGVPHSTFSERRRRARLDLAPPAEWFEKLDRYEALQKLALEFGATA